MATLRLTLCILLLCSRQSYCYAQEKSKAIYGKVSPQDFVLPATPIIDSNTNAVILSDAGDISFVGNKKGWFSYVYKRQTRIKILNKKAFHLATERIDLWINGQIADQVAKISASTYNLEEGKVVESQLDPKEVFQDRRDKNHTEVRFTLPAVREGSIIEYTYTITSDRYNSLPAWEFQSMEYPCLWSEYHVVIPQAMYYVVVKQGVHTYTIDKGREGHGSYQLEESGDGLPLGVDRGLVVNANTVEHQWAIKDIPAFHEESYLSSPLNYIDRLEFQLAKTYDGQEMHDNMNSWAKATEQLLHQEDFGLPITENREWLDDLLNKITANITDPSARARAIYYYVSHHFTCTGNTWWILTNLKDVVKKNSGTVGDINLLLIALLREAGFPVDPVILSTREHGFNLSKYPVLDRFNYVIAKAKIDNVIYYLDASHPQLGFGLLPENCYNGHARIISNTDSASIYFYADSLMEKKMTLVTLMNEGKDGLEGSYQSNLGPMDSYFTRIRVSDMGEKNYFQDIQTRYGEDMQISNAGIDSLTKLEDPLSVHYNFTLKQTGDASLIYFNPLFGTVWKENPFKAAERKYPVEMPYVMDETYLFSMQVPEGYVVDELPKSTKVLLNGEDGYFEYLTANNDGLVQLRTHLKLSRAYFPSEDYTNLRDFFAYIVKKESEQIVLRKK